MSGRRDAGIVPALAWALAAFSAAADLPATRAEGSDKLPGATGRLEYRLDNLAQSVPSAAAGAGAPVVAGGFPRSFLVPCTDVSLRLGGQAVGWVLWYLKGSATGGALGGTGGFNQTYVNVAGGALGDLR